MKVLVTGGAGYIGSVLVDRLITGGHQVNVIDDLSNGYLENIHKNAKFFQGSILDTDLLNKALDQIEVVLHLGAKIRVEEGESKPELYKQGAGAARHRRAEKSREVAKEFPSRVELAPYHAEKGISPIHVQRRSMQKRG